MGRFGFGFASSRLGARGDDCVLISVFICGVICALLRALSRADAGRMGLRFPLAVSVCCRRLGRVR